MSKTPKKRRSDVSADTDAPRKKEKLAEFNGTEFKAMLKEPASAMHGLQRFISTAKKLPSSDLYDVVEGYIKISGECSEVLRLLEGEKLEEKEMLLIFGSLEAILLRTASDLSHFRGVGSAVVKKVVSGHMKRLQTSCYSANFRLARQCLGLLAAAVSQGPEAAREVFAHLQISRSLSGLAKKKNKKGFPDVRLAFVQFVLSFLVAGDNALVGQILESRELLPEILSTGLKEDRMSSVNLILSTLKTQVVLNNGISKTQKVRFFTPAVLANIASLYRWNGIVDADDGMEGDSDGVAVVRDLAHSFLLELCCSRKHGISFHDASFGTAGRPGNIVLLQFLVGLKQATEDELLAELLVGVLKASPDVLARYFKETQHSYAPRLKTAWQDNVKLLKKIYEAQPDISSVFQGREAVPPSRLLSMILVISLPPLCNKAFFSQALGLANTSAQLTTMSILNFILKKASRNVEYLLDRSACSEVYRCEVMEELLQQYRETLSKVLPDMTSIVSKWQSLSKKEKPTDGGNAAAAAEAPAPTGAETAEAVVLKALILQVICLYQKVAPHLVSQCKFDFSKLLKGIVSEKGMREEVPPVLQQQILQLALDLPASKFSWFRIQDVAEKDPSSGEKSVLYLLLKMFVNSSHLKASTQKLVLKVLKDSGVFEYTWTELELWLLHLARLDSAQQETVIQFLEKVLAKLVCNSHTYTDKVAGLVQEAGFLQANLSTGEGDAAASIAVSHIDDVLDMMDVIMEGGDGEMEDLGPSLSEDLIVQTFPFSALVPAALEARNKLPAGKDVVHEYLCSVLSDVLHCQRDPVPLCLALLQYDEELDSSPHPSVTRLHHYYSMWLPPPRRRRLFESSECRWNPPPAPCQFAAVVKAAFIRGPESFLEDGFRKNVGDALASMSAAEFPVAVKQILLYVRAAVENFGTFPRDVAASYLKALMATLQGLVAGLRGLREAGDTEPAAGTSPGDSDLFLDQWPAGGDRNDQVLVSALGAVFKHPCLEQWFLAPELSALPAHALNPAALQQLCALMSDGAVALLKLGAPVLRELGRLDLLGGYMAAVERAVLRELAENGSPPAQTHSRAFRALLALHGFMDPRGVREMASRLLLLPPDSLVSPPGDGDGEPPRLSAYGQAALRILAEHGAASPAESGAFLAQAHLQGLGSLLVSGSGPAPDALLLQALSAEPAGAQLVHADVLLHGLRRRRGADGLAVAAALLRHSSTHRLRFEQWCLRPANMEEVSQRKEEFLPLINAYLQEAARDDPARPQDVQQEVLKTLKKALLASLSQCVLGNLSGDAAAQVSEALASLIKLSSNVTDIRGLISDLPSALQKTDTFDRWRLVDGIGEKLADRPGESEEWRKSVVAAAIKCLVASYSHYKDQASCPAAHEHGILRRLQQTLTPGDVAASDWNSFIKSGLKHRYGDERFLDTLRSLLDVMYGDGGGGGGGGAQKGLIPLSTLHTMASSHSLFLPAMLDSDQDVTARRAKEELISLLLTLVRKSPTVCNTNHFVILLGAYGASLSVADQKLLLLLQEYERNQVSLLKHQSFMWGPAAVEHHKTRKSLGASLWKQASSDDVLALLRADRMTQTVRHFPQQRRIFPQDDGELLYSSDAVKDLGTLYDPCFLLPLFSVLLQPECVVDCLKFVSSHALGVTVAALSSYDPKVRAAAYHVLGCFYLHLEGARFREKRQLLYLMDMVRNGVRTQNQRLPSVVTTYIAKATQQMLKPEDHMYVVLNRFLLSHQSLDFWKVPEFFKLFYSFDLEHKTEREWILSVLEEGLSDGHSFGLCNQQGVFQVLLGFAGSPLCDDVFQAQIIRVMQKAAGVTKAAFTLIRGAGLLTWMTQVVEKRTLDRRLLQSVIELLWTLWATVRRQRHKLAEREAAAAAAASGGETPGGAKCLSLPFVAEFLSVASAICKRLGLGVPATRLRPLLQTVGSALEQREAALAADGLRLPPQPLPCVDALAMLLCWARAARDAPLLARIQALAEEHKLKELAGPGKDQVRVRGSGPPARGARRDPEEAEEGEGEESALAECRALLGGVLVRWEPAIGRLAGDAARLVAGWCLRGLVEQDYEESRVTDFLVWLRRHGEAAGALDPGPRADLLRLYHRVLRGPATAPTVRIFTDMMVELLEGGGGGGGGAGGGGGGGGGRGGLPKHHHAIVSACRRTAPPPAGPDSGSFLLSLYVREAWTAAATAAPPLMFLSHVRLVSTVNAKRRKTPPAAVGVRAICDDIIRQET